MVTNNWSSKRYLAFLNKIQSIYVLLIEIQILELLSEIILKFRRLQMPT